MQKSELYKKQGVYVITNNINGKQYVGQSTNIQRRWYDHRSKSLHPRKTDEYTNLLYKAIRKDGLENFSISILEECEKDNLKEREIFWIKKLNTFEDGYNNSYGGDLPCITYEHHLDKHGKAVFSLDEVIECRQLYKQGAKSRDVYEERFKDRIDYSGFSAMWHGRTWKEVLPEVFLSNPRPAKKVTKKDIDYIRKEFENGKSVAELTKEYNGALSHTTIWGIANYKTYKDGIHYK